MYHDLIITRANKGGGWWRDYSLKVSLAFDFQGHPQSCLWGNIPVLGKILDLPPGATAVRYLLVGTTGKILEVEWGQKLETGSQELKGYFPWCPHSWADCRRISLLCLHLSKVSWHLQKSKLICLMHHRPWHQKAEFPFLFCCLLLHHPWSFSPSGFCCLSCK